MKVLVAVEQVPDPAGRVALAPDGGLDTSLARRVVNPSDAMALDVAWRLRESGAASEVVAVSVAPAAEAPCWDETLLAARARAADRAVLVTVDEAPRPESVAVRLAEAARRESPCLILCGRTGAGSDDGQTGPRLAGILGLPFLTGAEEVTVHGGWLTATRRGEDGAETRTVPLPAVVTCDLGARTPRPIPLPAILKAGSRPLERVSAGPLPPGSVVSRLLGYTAPEARGGCRMFPEVAALVEALRARAEGRDAAAGPLLEDDVAPLVGTAGEADALAWIAGTHGWPLIRGVLGADRGDGWIRYHRPNDSGRFVEIVSVPESAEHVVIVRGEGMRSDVQRARVAARIAAEGPPAAARVGAASAPGSRPDLATARVVVAGGRALHDPETFERLVGGLADALGGAVAASGGAVNAGIAPAHLLIGQTGRTVAPDLYVALGISGADQHVAGMCDARTVVAVNSDGDAPIFRVADLGLVADLRDAVPEWIARLSA